MRIVRGVCRAVRADTPGGLTVRPPGGVKKGPCSRVLAAAGAPRLRTPGLRRAQVVPRPGGASLPVRGSSTCAGPVRPGAPASLYIDHRAPGRHKIAEPGPPGTRRSRPAPGIDVPSARSAAQPAPVPSARGAETHQTAGAIPRSRASLPATTATFAPTKWSRSKSLHSNEFSGRPSTVSTGSRRLAIGNWNQTLPDPSECRSRHSLRIPVFMTPASFHGSTCARMQ